MMATIYKLIPRKIPSNFFFMEFTDRVLSGLGLEEEHYIGSLLEMLNLNVSSAQKGQRALKRLR